MRVDFCCSGEYNIIKEALNKSRHASCLHIFRLIARKLLEIHQVFLRHFHTINRKICLRNLHTRFNQRFLKRYSERGGYMNILAAAKTREAAQALKRFLSEPGYEITTATDGMTIRSIDLSRFDAIVISFPLENESGIDLFPEMRRRTDAHLLAIVKEEIAEKVQKKIDPYGGYVITKPLFRGALEQALRFCRLNMSHEAELRAKAREQKDVYRAKLLLIGGGMTEDEAHRHIQQLAMSHRTTQHEAALEIIRRSEESGE